MYSEYDAILTSLKVDFDMEKDIDKLNNIASLIIKIKTIQALDTSAELIAASRKVSRN